MRPRPWEQFSGARSSQGLRGPAPAKFGGARSRGRENPRGKAPPRPRAPRPNQSGAAPPVGGGAGRAAAPAGPAALCAEGTGDKTLLVKELIGSPEAVDQIAAVLPQLLPKFGGTYRTLGDSVPFGMMKWLSPELDQAWDRDIRAYLGLAFD